MIIIAFEASDSPVLLLNPFHVFAASRGFIAYNTAWPCAFAYQGGQEGAFLHGSSHTRTQSSPAARTFDNAH